MVGITTPNFEPHLVPLDEAGNRCENRKALYWAVVMKTGPGQYDWLTDKLLGKPRAAREMRRIREEMARLWWEKHCAGRSQS
ncbi:hypothetical protein LNAOJCKE_0972 [Methylorubrum aminovorans]|uniref:Transposase n=1 Tax=Methylorubrum aminovorans TaxID=269069 RepID=A0ABQ4U937_9HYPH|nr:hypothetical protein [Methylorubrum aminovorans]GJE63774.1 hypothetical protein LNAOJCKE_0972 [Methylorubrum aminovorans]GMA73615.1 hypothetical protein GCM10025880_00320 [Methylorubrum aminovorans]GMA73703.1 hypothetical protein GCM10025880_01200 [Methylorubrum aminovorans]